MTLLDLANLSAFTESFLLCSAFSTRQVEAIGDAIAEAGALRGIHLTHREGKSGAEWVLLDFGHVVAHVFTERARQFYDLERLWRAAAPTFPTLTTSNRAPRAIPPPSRRRCD